MPDAAFQIVSAPSASPARSRAGMERREGRGRQRRFQTPSSPRSPRSPRVFPNISRRSLRARRFKSGSAPSASPARSRAGMERGGGRGRQRRFQTPRSPRWPGGFPNISRGSLRARRFKSNSAPSAPPARSRAGTGRGGGRGRQRRFQRRTRRDRRGSSRKFLGVLCALGVSNRLRALCFLHALQSRHGARRGPRPPETISNAEIAEIAEGLPENFSAFSARSAFQTSPRPLLPPRAPEPAWSAERAEAARDDFKRRARRDRRGSSRKFLGVLCALGVSNGLRALCFPRPLQSGHGARRGPRPPETLSRAAIAATAAGLPENFSAFSPRSAFHTVSASSASSFRASRTV